MDGVTFLTDPMFSNRASPFPSPGRVAPCRRACRSTRFRLRTRICRTTTTIHRPAHRHEARGAWSIASSRRPVSASGSECRRRRRRSRVVEGHGRRWRPAPLCPGEALLGWRAGIGTVASGGDGSSLVRRAASTLRETRPIRRNSPAIGSRLGPIDLAAVPIGAYLPASIMMFVHTTPEEGLRLGLDVGARRSSRCTSARRSHRRASGRAAAAVPRGSGAPRNWPRSRVGAEDWGDA